MPAVKYTPIYTCKLVREGTAKTRPQVNSTIRGREVACELLRDMPNEVVVVVMLDTKLRIIGATEVTRGLLDASLVHPREFFRPAILSNAQAVIAVHNHPSGDLTPSPADHDVCRRLREAGNLLGIQLMDFLIVNSDDECVSFAERGAMNR